MLREKGLTADEVNFAKSGLDEAAVRDIVKAVGSVAPLVNPRHAIAKERGWADEPPSVDEFAREVARDANVIRRPILVRGKNVLVGYAKANQSEWTKLA